MSVSIDHNSVLHEKKTQSHMLKGKSQGPFDQSQGSNGNFMKY